MLIVGMRHLEVQRAKSVAQSLTAVKEKSWDLNSSVLAVGPFQSLKGKVWMVLELEGKVGTHH